MTANKRFANNWGLIASYRYSKLKGNFEGFFRSDTGQSDPSITSLFDFPTNDPSYTSIGAPQFGYQGDIRFQGTQRGGGIETVDAHADDTIKLGATQRIALVADAFNLFNRQAATNYDTYTDQGFLTSNPNFGFPTNGGGSLATGYQAPLRVRLGARFEW